MADELTGTSASPTSDAASTSAATSTPAPVLTPSPSADPVTSTPTATTSTLSSTPDKPLTALAALEKAASAQQTDVGRPDVPAEPTTVAPAPLGTNPQPADAPVSRIEAAVRNAREKERERLEQEWTTTYGSKDDVTNAVDRWNRMNTNPVEFLTALAGEIGYEVKPKGQPGAAPTATTPQELVDPEPDLQAQDGTKAYSAAAHVKLMANALERQKRELLQTIQPLRTAHEQAEQSRQEAIQEERARAAAKESFEIVSKLPHFDLAGVRAEYNKLSPQLRVRLGHHGALMTAYHTYFSNTVLPTLNQRTEAQTIEDLRRSAVAGSTTAAASAQAPPKKATLKDGDVDGLARHIAQLYGASQAV